MYLSVNEDNKGVFEILTQTLAEAKKSNGAWNISNKIYDLGKAHDIDPWDIEIEAQKIVSPQYCRKKQA